MIKPTVKIIVKITGKQIDSQYKFYCFGEAWEHLIAYYRDYIEDYKIVSL